jgi:hypothetical protein
MAEKNIISFLVTAFLPDHNETLLFAGFFDTTRVQLLLFFTTVIVGSDLRETTEKMDLPQFVHFIVESKDSSTIDTDLNNRSKEYFINEFNAKTIESIIKKSAENDTGALIHLFKKMIDHLLQLETTQVQMSSSKTSHGSLELYNAYERRMSHTVAENTEIARKYVGSNTELVKKVVEGSQADSIVIVYTVSKEGKIVSCGTLIFNEPTNRIVQKTFIYSQSISFDDCNLENNIVDVFHYIQKLTENQDANNSELCSRIDASIAKIKSDRLAVIFKSGESEKIIQFFQKIMPSEITSGTIELTVQKFNSIILDIAFEPDLLTAKKTEEPHKDDEPQPRQKAEVEVDLVISPTKGVKVSELQAGARIYVIINSSTPMGRNVVKKLNLLEENKVKPVSAVVERVSKTTEGYIIITRIASNLAGRAIEEEDVKVKSGDPVVDKKIEKSRKSLLVGIVVGLIFISLTALSLWILL